MGLASSWQEIAWLVAALCAGGALTGVLAGLFGVGGGTVLVPILYEIFGLFGVPDGLRMPLCVGTSLAVIIPTSLSSLRAHGKRGAVDWAVLRGWAPFVVGGVLIGALAARYAEPWLFKSVFVAVAGLNAIKLLAGGSGWVIGDSLPGNGVMRLYGAVIGLLSSLMGVGGGILSTMVFTLYGRPIHQAIATSAGVGVMISIPATLGYMAAGWPMGDVLPPLSLGFVSLPGVLLLLPATALCAPLGVKLAHAMPRRVLEVSFGCFLLLVAGRFVFSLI
jgi:uncharacterized membrane protein YfcA